MDNNNAEPDDIRVEILKYWDRMEETLKHLRIEFIVTCLGLIDVYRDNSDAMENARINWQRESHAAIVETLYQMKEAIISFIEKSNKHKKEIIDIID